MLSNEKIILIAEDYLKNLDERYDINEVTEEPLNENIYWAYDCKPDDVCYVVCVKKPSRGWIVLQSSYSLLIKKEDGKIVDFVCNNDEG